MAFSAYSRGCINKYHLDVYMLVREKRMKPYFINIRELESTFLMLLKTKCQIEVK
jgi:hypothetical protein